MALVLAAQEGEAIYIGDTKITVVEVINPMRFRVRVDGPLDTVYEIGVKHREEILPEVYLSAGDTGNMEFVKLVLEAPRNRVILRERLYRNAKEGTRREHL
jgi:sRNA-binding carbon storage regulator CsrA